MNKNNKIILQYDLEGNFLERYENINLKDIALELDIDSTDLSRAINNKIETAGNFQWRVEDRNRIPTKISQAYDVQAGVREIPIAKYYKGRFICVYSSMIDAAYKTKIDISQISRVCNLETSSTAGFVFKKIV